MYNTMEEIITESWMFSECLLGPVDSYTVSPEGRSVDGASGEVSDVV